MKLWDIQRARESRYGSEAVSLHRFVVPNLGSMSIQANVAVAAWTLFMDSGTLYQFNLILSAVRVEIHLSLELGATLQ